MSPQETKVVVETSAVRGPQQKVLQQAFQKVDQGDIQGALDHVQTMKHATAVYDQ